MNQHSIQHSLIEHLRKVTGLPTIWIYDGVVLPEAKPYITVEQMQNNNEILSKQREAVGITYRFQVGLFAASGSDRARRQDVINQSLLFDIIDLYDTSEVPAPIVGTMQAEVTNVVPISPENIAEKSKYHRVYFDVEIPTVMNRGKRK